MLQLGDLVYIKSNGPLMTVSNFSASDPKRVECVWFQDFHDEHWEGPFHSWFNVDVLVKFEDVETAGAVTSKIGLES